MLGGFFGTSLMGVAKSKENSADIQEFDAHTVRLLMDKLSSDMQNEVKKKKKLSACDLLMYGAEVADAAKWPEIEKETKIYRSWYVSIAKLCKAMGGLKDDYYTAKDNQDAQLIQECGRKYLTYRAKCIKLLENPPKIKKKQPKGRR